MYNQVSIQFCKIQIYHLLYIVAYRIIFAKKNYHYGCLYSLVKRLFEVH